MGRTKRIIDLVIRVVFILLCFVVGYLYNAVREFSFGDKISMAESAKVEILATNGAKATYSVEDGKIVIDVTTPGKNYNDIMVSLSLDEVKFDTAYYDELLGNDSDKYRDYLEGLKVGPWTASMHYLLTGDSILSTGNKFYTFIDGAFDEYSHKVSSYEANTMDVSEDMIFEAGDGAIATFIMGDKDTGALPAGKYYITTDIKMTGLANDELGELPTDLKINVLTKFLSDAMAQTSITSMFRFNSMATFYGIMIAFGCIFFMYQDLRAAFRAAVMTFFACPPGQTIKVLYHTYVNGVCVGSTEKEEGDGGNMIRLLFAMIVFMLVYMFFILTVPVRLIINICKDIYHIARDDDDEEGFPIFGNILGGIGIYALLFGFLGYMASWNTVLVIAAFVVGIPLFIIGGKLCKTAEEYWDF